MFANNARSWRVWLVCSLIVAWPIAACSESGDDEDGETTESADHHGNDSDGATEEGGEPTGSTCPSDSDLSYESFGMQFMEDYCVRCHSSELEGPARNGAPLEHDFDTLEGILVVAEHVDEYAAAGPDAENDKMPPDGEKPSTEEREQLGQWLACELEALEQ